MSDSKTRMDYLYKQFLGDEHALLERMEALKTDIPAVVDKAMGELSKGIADAQVAKIEASFLSVAEEVLRDIRKEASTAAPSGWKIKVAVSLCLVVALSGVAGAIVGAAYVKQQHGEEEARQIAAGKDFLNVLPMLDQPTRDRLASLIEKSRR